MKKVKYIMFIAAALFTLGSCADFLNTSSPSKSTPDVVFGNEDDTYSALLGVYDCLTADATYSQDLSIIFTCGSDIEVRSHSGTRASIDVNREPAHYLAQGNNAKVTRVWKALYECVERANMFIYNLEASAIYSDENHGSHEQFKRFRAEAITLRAMCYHELTRIWGNVPYKLDPTKSDLSNVYLPKSDRMEVFEDLIGQLEGCAADLPWQQATPERVTRGFAHGLAARLALYRAGWNFTTDCQWVQTPKAEADEWYRVAVEQCNYVIESGMYDLESTYFDYFYKQCQRQYSPQETLYEIGFHLGGSSELAYSTGVRYRVATQTYGYSTQAVVVTPATYYFSFQPGDDRRDITSVYYEYDNVAGITSATGVSAKLYTRTTEFKLNKWSVKWAPSDFHALSGNNNAKTGTGINFPMMRYSDVLLMLAEAEAELRGRTSAAEEALWKVRSRAIPELTRAQFNTYLSAKQGKNGVDGFVQAIRDERMWEFGGEGSRKYDLIRWGILPEAIIEMREQNGRIMNDWVYDFEFPVLEDGTTRALPQTLYYAYDERNEDIVDINMDYVLATSPGANYISSTGMWGRYQDGSSAAQNREDDMLYWNVTNSGIVDENGARVANGRPFLPVPSTVVTDYNDKTLFDYDYGFNF